MYKSIFSTILLNVLIIILFSGCVSINKLPIEEQTRNNTIEPSPSIVNLNPLFTRRCIQNSIASDTYPLLIDGTLVYSSSLWEIGLLDLNDGAKRQLGKSFPLVAVSTDYRLLAYTTDDPSTMNIIDSKGMLIQTIAIPNDWQGVVQWIDMENLYLERFISGSYNGPFNSEASAILYNLKTGTYKEIIPNFPSFRFFDYRLTWNNYSYTRMVFDPQLSKVIYPQTINGEDYLGMMEIDNQVSIISVKSFPPIGSPQWSTDGSFFIASLYPGHIEDHVGFVSERISTQNNSQNKTSELFQIDRNGEIHKLTSLTEQYNAFEVMPSLSPNDKYIAFWLFNDFSSIKSNPELAILNIDSGEIINLCLTDSSPTVSKPIWTDDNKIIVNVENGSKILLIDWEKGFANEIADEDRVAIAWMKTDLP